MELSEKVCTISKYILFGHLVVVVPAVVVVVFFGLGVTRQASTWTISKRKSQSGNAEIDICMISESAPCFLANFYAIMGALKHSQLHSQYSYECIRVD